MAKVSRATRAKSKPARAKAPSRAAARAGSAGTKVQAARAGVAGAKTQAARKKAPRRASPRPAPPPPARRAASRKRKALFDKKALVAIRQQLEAHRDELIAELEELEESAFNVSQSEKSGEVSYDEDYADSGSFTFEREKDLSIANNVQDLIDKIERAIGKIDDGTYGVCEVCGQPIETARIKALPHALLCVKDKAAEERR